MPKNAGAQPGQERQQTEGRRDTQAQHTRQPDTQNLTVRYGKIGIAAVAAAARYCDAGKNPAYAPAVARIDRRLMEMAA